MKSSKFYGSFQHKIDEWEKCLSIISEVVESILGVQRKWIYLEVSSLNFSLFYSLLILF